MATTKILIAGSSGLIGSALVPFLQMHGFQVARLLRQPQADQPYWDIKQGALDLQGCPCPDIVINLAGANIAQGRWTTKRKQQLLDSRIASTQLLVKHFKNAETPPKLFINASAIGFYGNRGQQLLDENSSVGTDFVSQLAQQWEQVSQGIKSPATRLVNLRTGIVLSTKGGALAKMLPAFKLGLGGKIGSGEQIMSWIDIEDFIQAVLFIINNAQLAGPVNMVAPNPISNSKFSQQLAKQLKRPCLFPLPVAIVKLLFGQMGEELLLASSNVSANKLLDAGFVFKYGELQKSLHKQLVAS